MSYQAKVIAGGKVVIPAELRREFDIKDGDSLVIERDHSGGLLIKTYAQVVREVRADLKRMTGDRGGTVVEQLLRERKDAAARENDEADLPRGPLV